MKQLRHTDIAAAVDLLCRGYEEECNLYTAVRDVTSRQREVLAGDADLDDFQELFGEKEDLLLIIGQMEKEMRCAKRVVLSLPNDMCPGRARLAGVLQRVSGLIEEIRALEQGNVARLEALPA